MRTLTGDKMNTKEYIRSWVKEKLKLQSNARHQAQQRIAYTVLSLPEVQIAHTLCVYLSKQDEVDTEEIVTHLLSVHKRVVVPKIAEDSLTLHEIKPHDTLTINHYGIPEPTDRRSVIDPHTVDMYIVPGLAFDRNGNRLGRGKGYYDRLLQNIQVPIVGLAFSCQIMQVIPHESHDKQVSILITEDEIIRM